ncbi:MAG: glycosyltransferase family 2 protein [Candidatus Thermoplasmatota archaeon]
MKISVVIPTINEEASIGEVIDAIPKMDDLEIIVVDYKSTDRTCEIARKKGAIVINEENKGYGRAYKTGFKHARGDVIVTMDGDMTYPAEEIDKFVKLLVEKDLDFITCDRISMLDKMVMSKTHRFGNWVLTNTMRLLFGLKLKDSQSGMWIFRKKILEKTKLISDGMPFSEELKIEAYMSGAKIMEIPIIYRVRKGEVKLSSWKDGLNNLFFLFKKKFWLK